jgi:hypothetical protein
MGMMHVGSVRTDDESGPLLLRAPHPRGDAGTSAAEESFAAYSASRLAYERQSCEPLTGKRSRGCESSLNRMRCH